MALSTVVGLLSSLLGIGGGIIHVPMLSTFFSFPEHIATATSHFVLMFMAAAATGTHVVAGDYSSYVPVTAALAVGVVAGARSGGLPLAASVRADHHSLASSWTCSGWCPASGAGGLAMALVMIDFAAGISGNSFAEKVADQLPGVQLDAQMFSKLDPFELGWRPPPGGGGPRRSLSGRIWQRPVRNARRSIATGSPLASIGQPYWPQKPQLLHAGRPS